MNPNHKPRRHAIVSIPSRHVLDLITGDLFPAVFDQLPQDARLIGVWHCHRADAFDLVVESESFQPVAEGCEPLRLDIVVTTRAAKLTETATKLFAELDRVGITEPNFWARRIDKDEMAKMLDRAIGGRSR